MKFAEPILIPIVKDELEVLKFATDHYMENYDIMCNYNYQRFNFSLLEKYVDPNLQQNFINYLENDKEWRESVYKDYFMYFISLYLRKKEENETLIEFLKKDRDFTYHKSFYPNHIYDITRPYNTVIILNVPKFSPIYNEINRNYAMIPNRVEYNKIIKKSVEKLVEGGKMYLYNDYMRFLWMKPDGIKIEEETDEYNVYIKEVIEKEEKIYRYNGL